MSPRRRCGSTTVSYGGTEIDLTPALAAPHDGRTGAGSDRDRFPRDHRRGSGARAPRAISAARVTRHENWGQALEAAFAAQVEDTLIQPTHVTGFPRDISPLAKADRHDPRLVERFETYVYGWEIANAFSELNDPLDQRARFEAQMLARAAGDDEAQPLDEDYVDGARIRAAAVRRARHRHRPAGHAADRQPVDPRRHRLSDDAPAVGSSRRFGGLEALDRPDRRGVEIVGDRPIGAAFVAFAVEHPVAAGAELLARRGWALGAAGDAGLSMRRCVADPARLGLVQAARPGKQGKGEQQR